MANRSIKTMLSARVSNRAAELLRLIRVDSGETVPALLERALEAIASKEQISIAETAAAGLDREARVEKAAKTLQKQLPCADEVQQAIAMLAPSKGGD